MLLKIKLALISAALAAASATSIVCDLLFSRALPIFVFMNTAAFALVCLLNMIGSTGIIQSYTPVSLTILWYGFGFSLASFVALALSIVASLRAYTFLRRARYAVQEQIVKRLVDSEVVNLPRHKNSHGEEK